MTPASLERAHAVLSASAAHRWMACTPSARLEETLPETTSSYAEEGSLAHKLAELKLRKHCTVMSQRQYNAELKSIRQDTLYNAEMDSYTDKYVEYVNALTYNMPDLPYLAVERRLDLGEYIPDGFGTGDCIILFRNTLHIVDLKYGKGVSVSAEGNPQMRLYALGAIKAYSGMYDVKRIVTHIVQPRLNASSSEELTVEELTEWGEGVKEKAKQAFAGLGEFSAGTHCQFCRAKAVCRARSDQYSALQDFGSPRPDTLSLDEIGHILNLAQGIEKWVADLEEYALAETLKGKEVDGWKAVEGRSNRQIQDVDAAFKALNTAGYDDALLYDRKPKTLTELEKLLTPKKCAELLTAYIVKPQGKPTLVPINDKREPINRITAAQDFCQSN